MISGFEENSPESGVAERSEGVPAVLVPNGPLPASTREKESWAHCLPLCPKCGEPLGREGKRGWKCFVREVRGKSKGCGCTDSTGKWRVEFFPTVPTLNQLQRERLNQLTLETWPNQKQAELRVAELYRQWKQDLVVPTQKTWLSPAQCRAAEQFFMQNKHTLEEIDFSHQLLTALKDAPLRLAEELIDFVAAFKACRIPCSPTGMVEYCKVTKWPGNLSGMPTFV